MAQGHPHVGSLQRACRDYIRGRVQHDHRGFGNLVRTLVETLRETMPSVGILVVDEKDTTIQARERYWEHNPRRGWRRLLPATMFLPPEPVDDFAAFVLAERVLVD